MDGNHGERMVWHTGKAWSRVNVDARHPSGTFSLQVVFTIPEWNLSIRITHGCKQVAIAPVFDGANHILPLWGCFMAFRPWDVGETTQNTGVFRKLRS